MEVNTENDMIDESQNKSLSEQETRAKLRESFLKAIAAINGKTCSILTYEKTSLNATFAGWNPDGSEILVRELETPACIKMSAALLRTPDIIAVKFDGVELS